MGFRVTLFSYIGPVSAGRHVHSEISSTLLLSYLNYRDIALPKPYDVLSPLGLFPAPQDILPPAQSTPTTLYTPSVSCTNASPLRPHVRPPNTPPDDHRFGNHLSGPTGQTQPGALG